MDHETKPQSVSDVIGLNCQRCRRSVPGFPQPLWGCIL